MGALESNPRNTAQPLNLPPLPAALRKWYRPARFSSRRIRRRVVFKNGECNVVQGNVAKRRRRYLQDIFTTLVDAQWRWTLLVFALSFLLSWLGFATLWWLIALAHGDFSPPPAPAPTPANASAPAEPPPEQVPCVRELFSFASCFLFSVETQHTIGYGSRSITEECPEAIFVMCLQSITGVMIQAFMVGIVFAKLSRPKKRTQTLLFSRNAVVCLRDGCLCLMFRVGDMRKSHIVEAHVRAQLIRQKVTAEGELLPFYQQEMRVGGDGEEERIFFIWPTTIVHRLDRSSPLYGISAAELARERLEVVVILEGVIESTGMTTQARSSYLPSEILWGHRFESLVTFKKETGEYEVDYSLFNSTYEVATPLCSAWELDERRTRLSDILVGKKTSKGRNKECTSSGAPYVAASPGPPPRPPPLPLSVEALERGGTSSSESAKDNGPIPKVAFCNAVVTSAATAASTAAVSSVAAAAATTSTSTVAGPTATVMNTANRLVPESHI